MRKLAFILCLSLAAPAAAQVAAEGPATPAPEAAASFAERENWCQKYAAWFVASAPDDSRAPTDVRDTHRLEVELQSCKLDPREYERQTTAELAHAAELAG